MNVRVLPVEEWGKLEVTGLPSIASDFDPGALVPLVVEEGGEIVATTTLVPVVHLESLWIREDKRNAAVVRQLMNGISGMCKESGVRVVMAQTNRENVEMILARMGRFLPVSSYVLRVGGEH